MGSDANGTRSPVPAGDLPNVFALVIYIPNPLGEFLDDLRRELVPHYNPRAHVSVLPPRPLMVENDWESARDQARSLAELWAPFKLEATEIRVFPVTDVIYLEVGAGGSELRRMHAAMDSERLAWQEPFPYHPHITLAQEVSHDSVREMREVAAARWKEFVGERWFVAHRVTFVCNSNADHWVDLAEFSLGRVPAARS
jgi:2'-5' RNA ligase